MYQNDHSNLKLGVVGEIWWVPEKCMGELDAVEGVKNGLFHRHQIWVQGHGDCIAYVQDMPTQKSWEIVSNGIWIGEQGQHHTVFLDDVIRSWSGPRNTPYQYNNPPVVYTPVPTRPQGHKIENFIWPNLVKMAAPSEQQEAK
jgi:hypothetical protein